MSLVVLTGTLATLQAAVISAARVSFAMARERVMPSIFRRVDPVNGNPWAATIVMSVLNLGLLGLALATDNIGRALSNVVSSLGLISILFYGLTGAAAVWQGRGTVTRSVADFVLGAALPGIGVLFMTWVMVESIRSGATSSVILAYGLGSVTVGALIALLLQRFGHMPFFHPRHDESSPLDETSIPREQPL
jgi:amino acid transporter